jgi:hypothetical protein
MISADAQNQSADVVSATNSTSGNTNISAPAESNNSGTGWIILSVIVALLVWFVRRKFRANQVVLNEQQTKYTLGRN